METKLIAKTFPTMDDLVSVANELNIKQEDIVNIIPLGQYFVLLYYGK